MYKPLADSTLLRMPKKEIIELLRTAEHNAKVSQEWVAQQAENLKDWKPVVHGRWMKRRNGGTLCSRCGHYTRYKGQVLDMSEAIACPWCGAKMDGESTKGDVEHGMGSKE